LAKPVQRKESVYIDSCCWIAQYKPLEVLGLGERNGLNALFDEVERGIVTVVASNYLYVECLTVSIETFEKALDGKKGIPVAVDDVISRQARELQFECYKIKKKVLDPGDAVHLVTAKVMGCKRFITRDGVAKKKGKDVLMLVQEKALLKRLTGLEIITPDEYGPSQKMLELVYPEGTNKESQEGGA
jgi:predicted nucleic acid-binding protein